ncbi:MAG: HesA/MoeB/ThiF family protein [Oscillospiraceae bacterium]|nr:HesA/MoeB/ThiF family protein [Oscillospiraceae bacterium]
MVSSDKTAGEIYSRQIMMKEIGEAGQQTLANASVLVVGCGGLGASALCYLTAMGIGRLGLCDGDTVALSNLNRQLLYTMDDIGKPKAETAKKRLLAYNPYLKTTVYDCFFDDELAGTAVPAYDIAVDCTDNFDARFILNDACVAAGKPFVHAGIAEFCGQLLTVTPGKGPCLRCLFPKGREKRESKAPFGAVGVTPGVLGALQALEVMKYLLGLPVSNEGLVIYDGLNMCLEKVALSASPDCICNTNR